jgi:hypothetical protein
LCRNQLEFIFSKLGLYDMYTPAWGEVLEEFVRICCTWIFW